jgi:prepilin-type N-terminal cleavage/methylation domain-containing protein
MTHCDSAACKPRRRCGTQQRSRCLHVVTGYTLIEMIAVICIISLLAAVGLSVIKLPLRQAQFDYLMTQVQTLDEVARARARTGEAVVLRFDTERGTVQLWSRGRETPLRTVHVSEDGTLASVYRQAGPSRARQVEVSVGEAGTTLTYAVCLRDRRKQAHWLVFMGLTGQCLIYEHESLPIGDLVE